MLFFNTIERRGMVQVIYIYIYICPAVRVIFQHDGKKGYGTIIIYPIPQWTVFITPWKEEMWYN